MNTVIKNVDISNKFLCIVQLLALSAQKGLKLKPDARKTFFLIVGILSCSCLIFATE